jgi:hypothetical protein
MVRAPPGQSSDDQRQECSTKPERAGLSSLCLLLVFGSWASKAYSPSWKLSGCRGARREDGVTVYGSRFTVHGSRFPSRRGGVHLVRSDAAAEDANSRDISGRWVSRQRPASPGDQDGSPGCWVWEQFSKYGGTGRSTDCTASPAWRVARSI